MTAGVILSGIIFLAARWPFSRAAVLKDLTEASLSRVSVASFHGTYFPRPGCVLERVTFRNPENGFAVLRDPISCKPAVMAETDRYVAFGTEYRALAGLPGIEKARIFEPEPAKVYAWEHR